VQKFVVVVRPQVMIIITIYAFKMVVIVQRTSKDRERERDLLLLLLHRTRGWLHMTESESLSLFPLEKQIQNLSFDGRLEIQTC
jgi:hypothetical protein